MRPAVICTGGVDGARVVLPGVVAHDAEVGGGDVGIGLLAVVQRITDRFPAEIGRVVRSRRGAGEGAQRAGGSVAMASRADDDLRIGSRRLAEACGIGEDGDKPRGVVASAAGAGILPGEGAGGGGIGVAGPPVCEPLLLCRDGLCASWQAEQGVPLAR